MYAGFLCSGWRRLAEALQNGFAKQGGEADESCFLWTQFWYSVQRRAFPQEYFLLKKI